MASFWQDLEEMQREIEKLDQTSKKGYNFKNGSVSSSRMKHMEDKTNELSQRFSSSNLGKSSINNSTSNKSLKSKMNLVAKDVEQTYDANSHLVQHLGQLEKEIEKLSHKEQAWKSTANNIHQEVHQLHDQIDHYKQNHQHQEQQNNNAYNAGTREMAGNSIVTEYRKEEIDNGSLRKALALKQQLLITKRDLNRAIKENKNLERVLKENQRKSVDQIARLNRKLVTGENDYRILKRKYNSSESKVDVCNACNSDLKQENQMLRSVADSYELLKESDSKLQLEYQKLLQDCLEGKREKGLLEQRLNNADSHIQEIELKCRQLNCEKMNIVSELRTMKQLFQQEQKRNLEKFERTSKKLEAELSYSKKMYQEIKKRYRELQHKFESDQPKIEQLRLDLDNERDMFHGKMHETVNAHVNRLTIISKQCAKACDNVRYIRAADNEYSGKMLGTEETDISAVGQSSQHRKLTCIWEPESIE